MNKRIFGVIRAPLVSEKTSSAAEREHSVAFWVRTDAKKPEIKNAVETMFEVKVRSVNTVNIRGQNKRVAGRNGRSSDRKKAYVTLMPGHEINFANE